MQASLRSYNFQSRWNRWLYHGLHSIELPWLYKHRPVWDIAVPLLLLGGTSLCVTSLLLAWGVLCGRIGAILEDHFAWGNGEKMICGALDNRQIKPILVTEYKE